MPENKNGPSPIGQLRARCATPCWEHLGDDYSFARSGDYACSHPALSLQNQTEARPKKANITDLRTCLVRSPEIEELVSTEES